MNMNQTNALVVKCYEATYPILIDLRNYSSANAPDEKASDKVRSVLVAHSSVQYARDMLYSLYCVFDELSERSCYKAEAGSEVNYVKHHARTYFYGAIAQWARACYDVEKEAPVITPDCPKDAEDDSDPYVKPSPKDTSVEMALAALQERLTLADFGKRRIDSATALFKSVVLERPSGATVLDVMERFGDEASEMSWDTDYSSACFWDACVQVSDDLRSDLAADQIKKASTVTVPEPDAVLWEVLGDSGRALYRTKLEAVRVARELFPEESVAQRDLRLRSRTIRL